MRGRASRADLPFSPMPNDPEHLKRYARSMRREPVVAERALWRLLRDRRLEGLKFRRQVPIGRYIADFLCLRHRLIVEADGPTHEDSLYDLERDAWLTARGFRVLRFANSTIARAPTKVLDTIVAAVKP
ncbi:MAG: endonuclease domain-containing protein [Caulobacteraceae bacterium]